MAGSEGSPDAPYFSTVESRAYWSRTAYGAALLAVPFAVAVGLIGPPAVRSLDRFLIFSTGCLVVMMILYQTVAILVSLKASRPSTLAVGPGGIRVSRGSSSRVILNLPWDQVRSWAVRSNLDSEEFPPLLEFVASDGSRFRISPWTLDWRDGSPDLLNRSILAFECHVGRNSRTVYPT